MTISPEQIEVGEAISRLAMSWIAFIATFLATAFFLGLLVWCIVNHDDWAAKTTVGAIDGFLLSLLHVIFRYVFPNQAASKKQVSFPVVR